MKSAEIKGFLSCSFREEDKGVVEYVRAICEALDINCVNVSDAYSIAPPEKAKRLIADSQVVIAIGTRRERTENGSYNMPSAVHDELSIAFALERPLLLFLEDGIHTDGFINNYGTHIRFFRKSLNDPETLRSVIRSIHTAKVESIATYDLAPEIDVGFYNEILSFMVELIKEHNEYYWRYSSTRKLVFTDKFSGTIRNGAWGEVESENATDKIQWKLEVRGGSKPFRLNSVVEIDTPRSVKIASTVAPEPLPGDTLEYFALFQSKHLNSIYKPENKKGHNIQGRIFDCIDGNVLTQRTKQVKLQFRFPREYGLRSEDIFPFVGSYSRNIDYLVESEMKRMKVSIDDFGGDIIVLMSIESPLLRHMYGIAWNIPESQSTNPA